MWQVRAFVVGAASWDRVIHLDHVPAGPGTVFAQRSYDTVGSTGAGKAMNLARLGHEVRLHTVLGDDDAGARVRTALREAGIHLHVDADQQATEQHVNLMTPDGDRVSIYLTTTAARDDLRLEPLVDLARSADVVVLNITDYVRRLVPELTARGIPFWTDLHDWDGENAYHLDFLAASHIVLSDQRLGRAARATCERLADQGKLVVCTHGSRGATAWSGAEVVQVPAHDVPHVVDTNGAGDAFTAGLIHALHLGWPLPRAVHAAAVAGATSVTSTELASAELTAELLEE